MSDGPGSALLTNDRTTSRTHRFELVLRDLPVTPLLEALAAHPSYWTHLTARQETPGTPHRDTESIFLRWPADQSVQAAFTDLSSVDYPLAHVLLPSVGPLVRALWLELEEPQIGRVLIVKLKVGGRVTLHADEGRYADEFDRFHIALQADGESGLAVGGQAFQPAPGEAWWFNHKVAHTAWNSDRATQDRIHLIIDCKKTRYRHQRGVTYQREPSADWAEDAVPLFEAHRAEITHYPDIPLDIDWDWYRTVEAAGMLRCYTARKNGGLVGYCVLMVQRNHRYRSSLQATQDVLYVAPAHRHGRVGLGLIRHVEEALRAEGVQVLYQHTKAKRTEGALMDKLGYELVDLIHAKRLDVNEGGQ